MLKTVGAQTMETPQPGSEVSVSAPERPKNWSPKYAERREAWLDPEYRKLYEDNDTKTKFVQIDLSQLLKKPLTKTQAKAIDKKIREISGAIGTSIKWLVERLNIAHQGKIHVALGFPSWTAYVQDAVRFAPADRDERKMLVQLMSGKGMSQRAIADVIGIDQATVSRDLSGDADASREENSSPDSVIGVDGKRYRRKPKPEPPLDVEVVEQEPELPREKPKDVFDLMAELRGVDQNVRKAVDVAQEIPAFACAPQSQNVVGLINAIRMKLDAIEQIAKGGVSDQDIHQLLNDDRHEQA
jgi:hypothetical protein